MRDLDGAEAMHRKALEIDEKLGRLEGMASHYGNLTSSRRGATSTAEAITAKRSRSSDASRAWPQRQPRQRPHLDGAEAMHRKSLEINEKLGHLEGMASDYGNLGNVLKTRGDLDGGEAMYRQGIAAAERLGTTPLLEKLNQHLSQLRE